MTLLPLLLTVTLALTGPAPAFDPIGGGPASNISATVFYITTITKDKIDFPGASLQEVIDFLNRWDDAGKHGVQLDVSQFPSPATIRVKLVGKGLNLFQAAGLLAEQAHATLLIEPGKITFIPKPVAANK